MTKPKPHIFMRYGLWCVIDPSGKHVSLLKPLPTGKIVTFKHDSDTRFRAIIRKQAIDKVRGV